MPGKVPSWVLWGGGATAALGLGYVGYRALGAPATHSAAATGSASSATTTGNAGPGPNSTGSASAATSASTSHATTTASQAAADSAEAANLRGALQQQGTYSSATMQAAQSAAAFNGEFVGSFTIGSGGFSATYDAAAAKASAEAFAAVMDSAHPGSTYVVQQDGNNNGISGEPIYVVVPAQSGSTSGATSALAASAGADPTPTQRQSAAQAGSAGVDALVVAELAKLKKAGASPAEIAAYLSQQFGYSAVAAGQAADSLQATGTLFGDPVPGYTPHTVPTAPA